MKKFLLLLLLLVPFNISALTVTVSWVPPVEREDNSRITEAELSGYNIYYTDTKSGDYINSVFVPGGSTRSYTLRMQGALQYFIVITAIDAEGRESTYSQEVSKVFSRPNKPKFKFGVHQRHNYITHASIR